MPTSSRDLGSRCADLRTDAGRTGNLTLERLRFLDLAGETLRSETETSPERALRISRVVFVQVRDVRVLSTTDVDIDHSVFWRGGNVSYPTIPWSNRGLTVDPASSIPERLVIRHSTFVANTGPAAPCVAGTLKVDSNDRSVDLSSNIFRNNGGIDIRLTKHPSQPHIPATLPNSIHATLDANRPLSAAPVATLDLDPQFVDVAGGDFRLQGASSAITSGRTDVNLGGQREFEGNLRWFGQAPDRGAFESDIGSTSSMLTVTNADDAGPGSLRQALIDANAAPDLNTIRFNIAGAAVGQPTATSAPPSSVAAIPSRSGSATRSSPIVWSLERGRDRKPSA